MTDPDAFEDEPTVLLGGRYELGELLGVGGTATVYSARDLKAVEVGVGPFEVAVKLLHQHLCNSEEARAEFLLEAERAASVRQANLVGVRGWGEFDGGGVTMVWIALDLVRGPTLEAWVRRNGALPPDAAAMLIDGVLAALEAVHAAGLVHRDITPHNIVLEGLDGTVDDELATTTPAPGEITRHTAKLLDLGLADTSGQTTVRSDGRVLGTARFISPEQARGLPVRAAADLYQVGAVLYFALTGRVPFERSTVEDTLRAHISAPPPAPSALRPAARRYDRAVTRALIKTPAKRYRSAEMFRLALGEARSEAADAAADATPLDPAPLVPIDAVTSILPTANVRLGIASDVSATHDPSEPDTESSADSPDRRLSGAASLAAVIVTALVIGFGVVAATLGVTDGGEAAPSPAPTSTATPTPSMTEPAPVDTALPALNPSTVEVPSIVGRGVEAQGNITQAGLAVGSVHRVESELPEGTVISQHPAAGAVVDPGSSVEVTIASGANVVPQLAGMDIATATAVLQTAGFRVSSTTLTMAEQDRATVNGSSPGAGAVLKLGVMVSLRVTVAPAPVTETPDTEIPDDGDSSDDSSDDEGPAS